MTKALIIGLGGPQLTLQEAALLRAERPLGIILFRRNVESPAQLAALTAAIRDILGAEAPILVDQEGGRVARLRPPHWPAFPTAASFEGGPAAAARRSARTMAEACLAVGLDILCAPVLDLRLPGAHEVIGDRAFSAAPAEVARLGAAFCAGILEAGATPVIKHIPGHGRALADSHHELPVVTADAETLTADLHPFRALAAIDGGAALWAMTAHVLYPAWDAQQPATLSRPIIEQVIRGEAGFEGVLVSDDLAMGALTGRANDLAGAALAAGCDIALHCSGKLAESAALLRATPPLHEASRARLATARAGAMRERDAGATLAAAPLSEAADPTATGRDRA